MLDTVDGQVTEIVDGDTFDMSIIDRGNHNKFTYNNRERIRIADVDKPELNTPQGRRSKDLLIRHLLHKQVQCHVEARDNYGRLVSKVKLVAR
ncbi:MAG: thermonuclease family protein [bacterium]